MLQRGRAPESAEIGMIEFLLVGFPNGFNGAALRRARRCDDKIRNRDARHASTGPRSGERGDAAAQGVQQLEADASTGPRSGERGDSSGRSSCKAKTIGFNGAALRRARRCTCNCGLWMDRPTLQRGRAPESAEIARTVVNHSFGSTGFNGAALRRARRCAPPAPAQTCMGSFNGAALRRARRWPAQRGKT